MVLRTLWLLVALVGHGVLWVRLCNQLHDSPLHYRLVKRIEKLVLLILAAFPLFCAVRLWRDGRLPYPVTTGDIWYWPAYILLCSGVMGVTVLRWVHRQWRSRRLPVQLVRQEIVHVDRVLGYRPVGDRLTALFARLPGNQVFAVAVNEKEVTLSRDVRLPQPIRVGHLSDLHFGQHIEREFFEVLCDRANAWHADLICITGDIIDDPRCLPWIPQLLGGLQSRFGCYFVLGNHELRRCDVRELRQVMERSGLVDLGGRCRHVQIHGVDVLLAGNESPWFSPPCIEPPQEGPGPTLRILLSHSPDQLPWARRHHFDVMFAGHTHGGQIQLPLLGPIFAPSRFGVRYAGGSFHEPPTVMHVSHGVCGMHALRFNCHPEMTQVILRRG